MEEKKLTVEAMIDSLKEMAIKFSKDTYVNRVLVNAINLIHRLQDENERLKDTIGEQRWNINDQKAEIERLTERKEFWENMHDKVCAQYENLEDKTEEYENAITMKQYRIDELQKQVDELKERAKIDLEHERVWGKIQTKQVVKDTAKEICKAIHEDLQATLCNLKYFITDIESQKTQEQQNIGIIKAQNAVSEFEKTIKKRYGVEVE